MMRKIKRRIVLLVTTGVVASGACSDRGTGATSVGGGATSSTAASSASTVTVSASDSSSAGGGGHGGASSSTANSSAGGAGGPGGSGGTGGSGGLGGQPPGGVLQWAKNFGLTGYTQPTGVAIDATNGDIVAVGSFTGSVDFGGGPLLSHGSLGFGLDAFVTRFDSSGNYKWANSFGNGLGVVAQAVSVSASSHVIVVGTADGDIDAGCGALAKVGDSDLYLVDFDATGKCIWSRRFGAPGQSQNVTTIASDGAGNVVIAGQAFGGLDFGNGPLNGFYLAKFDAGGATVWAKAFPATSTYGGPWLAVDAFGNSFLGGSFNSSTNFGGGIITSVGSSDAFLAKFDDTGKYLWAKQYGDSDQQDINGVGTDLSGNVFVVGDFSGVVDFGSGPLDAIGSKLSHAFVAKLGSSGNAIWSKAFVSGAAQDNISPHGVVGGVSGAPKFASYLAGGGFGAPPGSIDYGGGPLSSQPDGNVSLAVASLSDKGSYGWAYSGGPPSTAMQSGAAYAHGLATDASKVVIVGYFGTCASLCTSSPPGTTLVIAGKTLTAMSASDFFIASVTP